jgi:hypothetical protein
VLLGPIAYLLRNTARADALTGSTMEHMEGVEELIQGRLISCAQRTMAKCAPSENLRKLRSDQNAKVHRRTMEFYLQP